MDAINRIIRNMYDNNLISNEDEENIMSVIEVSDYIITIKREKTKYNIDSEYNCIIEFRKKITNQIYTISCNEFDAVLNSYHFEDFNSYDMPTVIFNFHDNCNYNEGRQTLVRLYHIDNDNNIMYISDVDISTGFGIDIITLNLTNKEFSKLCDIIYFIWIIDFNDDFFDYVSFNSSFRQDNLIKLNGEEIDTDDMY